MASCAHAATRSSIGRSVEGRSIEAYTFSGGTGGTLVLGGMHGDEPKGVYVARRLIGRLGSEVEASAIVIVPVVNPDGYHLRRRCSANGVDLNRNFPTADWSAGLRRSRNYPGPSEASEPETQAIIELIDTVQPVRIVTIHSINRHRECNNNDGPARALADEMAKHNGYPVTDSIGYPTPGSFGTWAGGEGRIPTVTLELPSHHSPQRCWRDNEEALAAICRLGHGDEIR